MHYKALTSDKEADGTLVEGTISGDAYYSLVAKRTISLSLTFTLKLGKKSKQVKPIGTGIKKVTFDVDIKQLAGKPIGGTGLKAKP